MKPMCSSPRCHVSADSQLSGPYPSPFRMATAELSSWSVVLGSLKQEGQSPGAEEVGEEKEEGDEDHTKGSVSTDMVSSRNNRSLWKRL